jgi:DNA-binding NarL/FixJ family response regulator
MGRDPAPETGGPIPIRGCDLRVLIVEHGAILREGMRHVVDGAAGLRVVATATEPEAALTALRTLHPDVVLIDARLPNQMAFFLTRTACREWPSAGVVMLSDDVDEVLGQQAAEAGAAAVVVERIGADDLGAVLRTVGGGSIDFLGYVVRKAG